MRRISLLPLLITGIVLLGHVGFAPGDSGTIKEVDWPSFMKSHDMMFTKFPVDWKDGPHFGNASIGSMFYKSGNAICLQICRNDVHDHRDNSHGWAAYSRPRLLIGHFSMTPVGNLKSCNWRKDLWNAEMTGTITTDKGEIKIRHFVHADDMAIVTELTPSEGEKGFSWDWHPKPPVTTRPGQSKKKKYGTVFRDNPKGRKETKGDVTVWIQDFQVGGQYATAWAERKQDGTRTHIASIHHTYPEKTAAETAVKDVKRFLEVDTANWTKSHRKWWHEYYPRSYVTIPDKDLEAHYWQTMYRYGSSSRTGRAYIDCPGIWFQGYQWAYTTTDWNIQCAHWATYAANRLEQCEELLNVFHDQREELIKAVRPVEWQKDSSYLAVEVSGDDLRGSRDQDKRYVQLIGCLPWTMNNFWSQYRYSMDDDLLREKIFPMLRRSTNMYLHMLKKDKKGKLHLPPTFSPEMGVYDDANFDLALLKWSCLTLIKACDRLKIDDPLLPKWKEVLENLIDYPTDEHGFRLGSKKTSDPSHRHFSHLLMIYPLYLVNIEQEGTMEVLKASYIRSDVPGRLPAMAQAHLVPIGATIGMGDKALAGLKTSLKDMHPNGFWHKAPCLESSLGIANGIQELLIQSWTDPAKLESGPIRLFPALPSSWKDVEFHDLRTEGAFLVSAKLAGGELKWVRIKSLAGEPCRLKAKFTKKIRTEGGQGVSIKESSPGIYTIEMKKGDVVLLHNG